MTRRRTGLLGLAAAAALAGAAAWAERAGVFAAPEDLGSAPAAVLDTLALAGRHVTVSVGGAVVEAEGRRAVVARPEPLLVTLPEADSLVPGDILLATGRLRERRGVRRVEARAWTVVRGAAAPARDSARASPVQ